MSAKSSKDAKKSTQDALEALYREAEEAVERKPAAAADAEGAQDASMDDELPVEVEAAELEDDDDDEHEADDGAAERIEALEREAKEARERHLRAVADLENFRRRSRKEIDEGRAKAKEDTLRDILPVMDNLDRALSMSGAKVTLESLLEGVNMVKRQFQGVLERLGAQAFDSAGEPFDPARHEALSQAETADQPPGTVVHEMQKGYMLGNRLLRPALVSVAKAPSAPPEDAQAGPDGSETDEDAG